MQALTLEGLRSLATPPGQPCVSAYLPTHRGRMPEDRDRLEGLLRRIRQRLEKQLEAGEVEAMLAPLDALRKPGASRSQDESLAFFLAPGFHVQYRLPIDVSELLLVGNSFHIRPLLRFLETNQHYFVLSLAQGHVSFFKGSAEGIVPLAVAGLPSSLVDALGQEETERSVSYHFGARGGKDPIYGGGGKSDGSRDEDHARFHRAVDRALWNVLRDEKAPLIVSAPGREGALFLSITRYPHVSKTILGADLGRATLQEIHEHAWPVVQAIVGEREGEVIARYDRLVSRGRALDEVRAIAQFALQGRVSHLLIDRGTNLWGRFDRVTGAVALHGERPDEGGEDVLDDLAEAVLLRGGEVWSLAKERMPSKSPVAAALRW